MKTYVNWSSGKDAAMALHQLQQQKKYDIKKLVTTVNANDQKVSMHQLSSNLLEKQAEAIGIPLQKIVLNTNSPLVSYNEVMNTVIENLRNEGFSHCVFGDIFLEDLRNYREGQLENTGITPIFPLWKKSTKNLMKKFIADGFKAITVCVNADVLDETFCGRLIDLEFLEALPKNVDPCGENGEYHSFVFDGPIFKNPVKFQKGKISKIEFKTSNSSNDNSAWATRFYYCDLH